MRLEDIPQDILEAERKVSQWMHRNSVYELGGTARRDVAQGRVSTLSAMLESGYCCCGGEVDMHGMGDGHSPVDEGSYAAMRAIEESDKQFR